MSHAPRQCRLVCMSTVAEIKAAISQLTLEERAEVARCLHEREDDAWDKQIQQDLAAGKLDGLLAKVDEEPIKRLRESRESPAPATRFWKAEGSMQPPKATQSHARENVEGRMQNLERPGKASPSHLKAIN